MSPRVAFAALALLLLPVAARGDPIVITFTSPVNQALPAAGGTIIIQGHLTNTSGAPVTIVAFGFDSHAQIGSFNAVPLVITPLVLLPGEKTSYLTSSLLPAHRVLIPGTLAFPLSGGVLAGEYCK